MSAPASLVEAVQGLLERTYRMPRLVHDVGRFLIGDDGFRRFYAEGGVAGPGAATTSAKTLVRETASGVRAAIYYPDALIATLEAHPPQLGLREANVDAFAVLVEEIDHLLCIAERAHARREVRLVELELHANVSKHLVLSRFLAGSRGVLDPGRRTWLRYHLFHKSAPEGDDDESTARYRDATRFALRFLDGLEEVPRHTRLRALRRFHEVPLTGKLELIRALGDAA